MAAETPHCDGALIVGAGLAGLFAAVSLAPAPCTVLSPAPLGDWASSAWAQGGVAAALAEGDSAEAHAADTVAAGAGLVDAAVARMVAGEAAARIEDLLRLGAPFDRDAAGVLKQSREAAHSAARVVRVGGDGAGRAIMATLIAAVRARPSIRVIEGVQARRLLTADGAVRGVACDGPGGPLTLTAGAVLLATGGVGGLYAVTTNPAALRGEGLGMAALAGAEIADPEFVQFHPTGLAVDADPTPLASEALRGDGAVLIDEAGRRLMTGLHPDGDLAPRDVVARAIHAHLAGGGRVFLDARAALGDRFDAAFPTVAAHCRAAGIDPTRQPIPVRPVQHYHMGGVAVDADGATSLPGLYACGEVARTGLHGANRLASNSLLEALVFGRRAADAIAGAAPPRRAAAPAAPGWSPTAPAAMARLRAAMTAHAGVQRDGDGLRAALRAIDAAARAVDGVDAPIAAAATLIAAAALRRRESRGGHARSDFPQTDATPRATRLTLAEAERDRDAVLETAP